MICHTRSYDIIYDLILHDMMFYNFTYKIKQIYFKTSSPPKRFESKVISYFLKISSIVIFPLNSFLNNFMDYVDFDKTIFFNFLTKTAF